MLADDTPATSCRSTPREQVAERPSWRLEKTASDNITAPVIRCEPDALTRGSHPSKAVEFSRALAEAHARPTVGGENSQSDPVSMSVTCGA
jgi:hypothetical protein